MHLGIERPRRGGIAQWRDGLGVPSLPRERDSEIERRIRIRRPPIEHETKRPLGIGELFPLKMLPSRGEARIDRRNDRRLGTMTGLARNGSDRE